jgi:methionine-gamma-lyase
MGFGTKAIHSGEGIEDPYSALNIPIYQNATFKFANCKQAADSFAGLRKGYFYSRSGNPTVNALETRVAVLENAEASIAFSSGMAAISSPILAICKSGSHIIADNTLYSCTYTLLGNCMARYGVSTTFTDLSDLNNLKNALQQNTVIVYLETPANPNLKILDIENIAKISHDYNKEITVICDNTFASPFITRPLDFGADVVVHSATKYLNGHGDLIAGLTCGKGDFLTQVREIALKDMTAAVLGPSEAYLLIRGIKTMELRMERHCSNAEKMAVYLKSKPQVAKVHYPGLPEHPHYEVAQKQMYRGGGMVSFELKGSRETGAVLLDHLKLCALAVSLGDAETLVEHPASMTHAHCSAEVLHEAGIAEGLIRLSLGLENCEDIIADFEQAFSYVKI